MTIASNGDIGIGTPAPGSKLEVCGEIRIKDADNSVNGLNINAFDFDGSAAVINYSSFGNLYLGTDTSIHVTITPSGNVGIGTTSPGAKLDVDGLLNATYMTSGGNTVLDLGNFNSYIPNTEGLGAYGTWGISVTGNAATATSLSTDRTNWSTNGTINDVVGQLAWKNYGNNHTIFDASQSTSPSGGGVNNTNAAVAWAATYPTLMGWNGVSTYGVRVDLSLIHI